MTGTHLKRRFAAETLRDFACALAVAAGLPERRARRMAEILVEADMMGRSTHGIEHLDWYLTDLVNETMNKTGDPTVVADRGAAVTWDGHYLPGTWLVTEAMVLAVARSRDHPVVTVVIRDSHHVGFHAAYLRRATERGLVMLLLDTNPYFGAVAPYGGRQAVFSPTPVSFGFPTAGDPVLVDFALSSTSLTATERAGRLGERLPHAWLLDHEGNPSDDPQALLGEPRGSILPLGGAERGHKGYGLQFMVYALSAALGGFGIPDSPRGYSSAVFLQVINPEIFPSPLFRYSPHPRPLPEGEGAGGAYGDEPSPLFQYPLTPAPLGHAFAAPLARRSPREPPRERASASAG